MSSLKKRARILKVSRDLRSSYWFVPSVLIITSIFLGAALETADRAFGASDIAFIGSVIDLQPDAARALVAVLAQAIIGVTGVMFSMTLVAVSFASGNFGPRLIGNFMRDRGNQWSLGVLISSFVFAVIVLRAIQNADEQGAGAFVPHLSLIVVMLLSLVCIFVIVYFIHHVPETINVSRISASLGNQLESQIRKLIDDQPDEGPSKNIPNRDPDLEVTSQTSGYFQACDFEDLETLAEDGDWIVEVVPSMGAYVTVASPIFRLWGRNLPRQGTQDTLHKIYSVGPERTEYQNPTFISQQLVEMVARALSSGVNDPYTAMDCLNRLAGALTVASLYEGGLSPNQRPRVKTEQLTFEALFADTFPLCRQYVRPDDITRNAAVALLEILHSVARPTDKDVIEAELSALRVQH